MIVLVFPSVGVAHTAGGDDDEGEDGDEHGKHGQHCVCVLHTQLVDIMMRRRMVMDLMMNMMMTVMMTAVMIMILTMMVIKT